MKALYFDGQLSLREIDAPRPSPDEALIRVRLAGVCGTDLQILKGYSAFRGVPGHEFVGEVVECETAGWAGKRVVGEINVTCGRCDACRRGLGRHCASRTVMGIVNRPGAFAEYVTLPLQNLHEVPVEVPDEAAVFTEPLAAACEILEQMPLAAGTRVAVLGAGRLGLLVAQVLRHAGAEVTVIGRSEWKLKLARSWGLKTNAVQTGGAGLAPRSFAVVVEATGSPLGLEEALRLVEPRGTVVMKSTFHEPAQFDTANLVVNEITLLGSRCGNFKAALDLLSADAVHVEEMISRVFPLAAGPEAFAYLEDSSCLKVLLNPQSGN
ncbi:MAG TPA: alcohol dehydrogenase catalytic domain-containing protein [Terriglobia bacterium]|nr:alcohol dehydrogenase catalytic domain-containing protein [Terriglobia bacterium]